MNSADLIPVIILNWNGESDTVECLKSIKRGALSGFLPVLVDNGSESESLDRLKAECSQIFSKVLFLRKNELSAFLWPEIEALRSYLDDESLIFVENGENLGFARANNLGIRFAQLVGSPWVMLLNNDTVVESDMFRELRSFRDTHPSFVAITPQIRHYGKKTIIQNCGGDLTYFARQKYKFEDMDASVAESSEFSTITFITGCALLYKYDTTGALAEDFFFGEEDYEFSLRMKKRGLKMACAHRAVVYHKRGVTIGKNAKRFGNILLYYVNRLIDTRNYYSSARWHATRILAYLYLPFLFAKSGINPLHSITAMRRVQAYIKRHHGVSKAEFQSLIIDAP